MYALRDYQEEARGRIREEIQKGHKSIVCVAPTGAGKTLIACKGIIEPAVENGKRVWFIAPRTQLIHQTSDKLDEIGVPHGVIMANHWRRRSADPVQVCSQQTLIRRLDSIKSAPDVIVIDEAHHVTDKNSLGTILARFPDAVQIGFTATPVRLDGRGLGCAFSSMVIVETISALIERGYLVPPRWYRAKQAIDLSGIKMSAGDFNQKQLGQRVDRAVLVGNIVVEWLEKAEQRPTVCFATNVQHSHHIVEQFDAAGVPAVHIDANTSDSDRQEAIARVKSGAVKVLSSVGVFTEGFDLPATGCVILARPTASLGLYIQMAGRGLRPRNGIAEPGEDCIFLDHANLKTTHGPVDWHHEWTLDDKPKRQREKERKEVLCKRCHQVLEGWPSKCPNCGAELKAAADFEQRELAIDDGVRLELDNDDRWNAETQHQRKKYYAKIAKEAEANCWKPAAVGVRFKAKFGDWPNWRDMDLSDLLLKRDKEAKEWTLERRPDAKEPAPVPVHTVDRKPGNRIVRKPAMQGDLFEERKKRREYNEELCERILEAQSLDELVDLSGVEVGDNQKLWTDHEMYEDRLIVITTLLLAISKARVMSIEDQELVPSNIRMKIFDESRLRSNGTVESSSLLNEFALTVAGDYPNHSVYFERLKNLLKTRDRGWEIRNQIWSKKVSEYMQGAFSR